MGWLGRAQIVGDERLKCLNYYEAEVGVTAFQTREADLFNEMLGLYDETIAKRPEDARKVCVAAHRLARAAREIIHRRDGIRPVPQAAYSLHWAWRVTSVAYETWAQATLAAMEALADGQTPQYKYVQQLVSEHAEAWFKVQKEEKKFLKQLRMPADEIAKIVDRSIEVAEAEDWQTEQPSISSDEDAVTEVTVSVCS